VSGRPKITYIGHSQGTSQMFYALSTNEDSIASKVNLFIALAPVVRFKNAPWYIIAGKLLEEPIRSFI
jgi:pimeloyl-ACP methyl ester carboxylesterase